MKKFSSMTLLSFMIASVQASQENKEIHQDDIPTLLITDMSDPLRASSPSVQSMKEVLVVDDAPDELTRDCKSKESESDLTPLITQGAPEKIKELILELPDLEEHHPHYHKTRSMTAESHYENQSINNVGCFTNLCACITSWFFEPELR